MTESQPVPFNEKLMARMKQKQLRMTNGDVDGVRRDEQIGEVFKRARETKGMSTEDLVGNLAVEGVGRDEIILLEAGLLPWLDLPGLAAGKLTGIFPEVTRFTAIGKLVMKDNDLQGNL